MGTLKPAPPTPTLGDELVGTILAKRSEDVCGIEGIF
jgi:hypothetical protein